MSMTENEAIYDLKFIKKGYENLAKNGADSYRAVGKGVDCSVQVETNEDLYKHYVDTMNIAIKALERQTPKKPKEKLVKVEIYNCGGFTETETRKICPVCKAGLVHETFCYNCGQKLDWS